MADRFSPSNMRRSGKCPAHRTGQPALQSKESYRVMNLARLARLGKCQRRAAGVVVAAAALLLGTVSAVSAASSVVSASALACAANTQVQTAQGPVCGIVDNGVTEWLGVPYAAPPVGALRWESPHPHA